MKRLPDRAGFPLQMFSLFVGGLTIGFAGIGFALGDEGAPAKCPRLEFRILANEKDDATALAAAKKYFADAAKDASIKKEIKKRAEEGEPPAPVKVTTDKGSGLLVARTCSRLSALFAVGQCLGREHQTAGTRFDHFAQCFLERGWQSAH